MPGICLKLVDYRLPFKYEPEGENSFILVVDSDSLAVIIYLQWPAKGAWFGGTSVIGRTAWSWDDKTLLSVGMLVRIKTGHALSLTSQGIWAIGDPSFNTNGAMIGCPCQAHPGTYVHATFIDTQSGHEIFRSKNPHTSPFARDPIMSF